MGDLPTRNALLSNGLTRLDTCSICLNPFSSTHVAVRFTGAIACCHGFGEQCLRKWLLSGSINPNKCPTCRRQLYQFQTDLASTEHGEEAEGTLPIEFDNESAEEGRERDINEDALSDPSEQDWSALSSDTDGDDIVDGVNGGIPDEIEGEQEDGDNDGSEEEGACTVTTGFPNDVQDITDPAFAHLFVEILVHHVLEDRNRDERTGRDLRSLVRLVCQNCEIQTFPTRRSVHWRHMCSVLKRLQRNVRRPGVSDNEIRQFWVKEMAEALDWRLEMHEEVDVNS